MISKLFPIIALLLMPGTAFNTDSSNGNKYYKEYYETGKIKAEGWLRKDIKVGYWKFYHANGELSMEGHYKNNIRDAYWYFYTQKGSLIKEGHFMGGKMVGWWLFYDPYGQLAHKYQLNKGVKNGYGLTYANGKIVSAEKYRNGQKIKEWFSFNSFKHDNDLSDLK